MFALQLAAAHGTTELVVKSWQSVIVTTRFRLGTKESATARKIGLERDATVSKKKVMLVLKRARYAGTDNVHVKTVTPELEPVVEVRTVSIFLQRIENC